MLSEAEMLSELAAGYEFPPLVVRRARRFDRPQDAGADALIELALRGRTYRFAAEFKARSSPKAFAEALAQLERCRGRSSGRRPLLVVPYLREEQLKELERREFSGLDLSGNGVVIVPGKLLVFRTGRPNRYPESAPTKYAYRGATSLVARVFLARTRYASLTDIQREIEARGGHVVLSTISKALKRMESDLITARGPDGIRLLQPDKLLEALAASYIPPKITRSVTLASDKSLSEMVRSAPVKTRLVLSGQSSIAAYAVMGRSDWPVLYTPNVRSILRAWAPAVQETSRFVDLQLCQTDDPTVYFDARPKHDLPYASPAQVFLECSAGDKREQETGREVAAMIVREVRAKDADQAGG